MPTPLLLPAGFLAGFLLRSYLARRADRLRTKLGLPRNSKRPLAVVRP